MKLRTVGLFALMVAAVLMLNSCKSTKKVKTVEPAENAESVETEVFTATEETFDDTPAPDAPAGEDDYYYDDTEEVFVDVNENDYMYVDDKDDYSDIYSSYDNFDSEFIETGYDDSLVNNDYSDDYPAEKTDVAATTATQTTTPVTETKPAETESKPAETAVASAATSTPAASAQSTTDGKKGTVSSSSFYIDYNSPEYSDYSGYDYGDKSYNETLQKFGPASFPSDKIMAKGRKSAKQLYNYFASKNPKGDLQRAWILAQLYIEECA